MWHEGLDLLDGGRWDVILRGHSQPWLLTASEAGNRYDSPVFPYKTLEKGTL